MKLLLINPNTSLEITALVERTTRHILGDAVDLRIAGGAFGARYIASRAAYAVAGHAALDAAAMHADDCDAILLACFGEPGLDAVRELASVPVAGLAESSFHLACMLGRRVGIVTGGERWPAMLEDFYAMQRLDGRLAGIRAVAPTGAEIARDPAAAVAQLSAACTACAHEDGAEVVILAGAGLAGLAAEVGRACPVPVICSLEAGLRAVQALAALQPRKAQAGSFAATPAVATTGLSAALAKRFDD